MSAPAAKSTGEKTKSTRAASGRKTRGSARSKPSSVKLLAESGNNLTLDASEGVKSAPRNTRGSAAPHSKRAEAIRGRTPAKAQPKPPRHDTANSARPRILAAARKMAAERGYTRLRLCDITAEAQITHQGFYGHFANRRHAVAVATSDELGAIADLAMRGSQRDEGWAERLLADIDKALIEAYPAKDGPELWLRDRFIEAFSTEGGYSALRINELIKVSRLGHGEFYRRYGGKLGCLRRIYAEVLGELRGEVLDGEPSLLGVGRSFSSEPQRSRFLILGASHLPDDDHEDSDAATQGSLPALLKEIAAAAAPAASEEVRAALAGGLLEVVRSAVLAERIPDLDADLRMLGRAWGAKDPVGDVALAA